MAPLVQASSRSRPTHVRYVVLGLTVVAYMLTYMDRQILATARPAIMEELGISLVTMGWVTFAFRMAYSLFQIPGGWLGDTIGARRALAIVVSWWSAFTALTAIAWNAASMIVIQVFFGLGEAGAFPIATRSLSRWMRPTERGFAQGITHAGSRLGGAITPPIVALAIMPLFGWRAAFYSFGVLGAEWAESANSSAAGSSARPAVRYRGGKFSRTGTFGFWRSCISSTTTT
jgi:MFS family permease